MADHGDGGAVVADRDPHDEPGAPDPDADQPAGRPVQRGVGDELSGEQLDDLVLGAEHPLGRQLVHHPVPGGPSGRRAGREAQLVGSVLSRRGVPATGHELQRSPGQWLPAGARLVSVAHGHTLPDDDAAVLFRPPVGRRLRGQLAGDLGYAAAGRPAHASDGMRIQRIG